MAIIQAQESIRIDVNLVSVAFSVRDANGKLIDNLKEEDFEVTEDSAPQKIAFFAKKRGCAADAGIDRGRQRQPGSLREAT